MFQLDIKIDTKVIEKALKQAPKQAVIALTNTLNRAAKKVDTQARKAITEKYNIQHKHIKGATKITNASSHRLSATIRVKGDKLPLSFFGGKQKKRRGQPRTHKYSHAEYVRLRRQGKLKLLKPRPSATYRLLRTGGNVTIPGAFMATLGHKAGGRIYKRRVMHFNYPNRSSSGGVFPVKLYKGPSIPALYGSQRVKDRYAHVINEFIPKEFYRRFGVLMKQAIK